MFGWHTDAGAIKFCIYWAWTKSFQTLFWKQAEKCSTIEEERIFCWNSCSSSDFTMKCLIVEFSSSSFLASRMIMHNFHSTFYHLRIYLVWHMVTRNALVFVLLINAYIRYFILFMYCSLYFSTCFCFAMKEQNPHVIIPLLIASSWLGNFFF